MSVPQYRLAEISEAIINLIMPSETWCTNQVYIDMYTTLSAIVNASETDDSYETALDEFIEILASVKEQAQAIKASKTKFKFTSIFEAKFIVDRQQDIIVNWGNPVAMESQLPELKQSNKNLSLVGYYQLSNNMLNSIEFYTGKQAV